MTVNVHQSGESALSGDGPGLAMPRNLGLDLVRATEATALAAARWMGLGLPEEADLAASKAMLGVLGTIEMDGIIAVGEEGRLGTRSGLRSGMVVGRGYGTRLDVAADPIDGRILLAQGHPGAISAIAVSPRGTMWAPAGAVYMDRIVVDSRVAPYLVPECMDAPAAWTLALVARAKATRVTDLTVFVLDRPRHSHLIQEIRSAGSRVMLRSDGDVIGAVLAAYGREVDILMGVGGMTEALLSACAVKALGGGMLARLAPQSERESAAVRAHGESAQAVYDAHGIVRSDRVFFAATGITEGSLLSGVQYEGHRARSASLVLRGETRTRRLIFADHLLAVEGAAKD